ncbi:CRISPR/Cas system CSM-associated protein Csm3 (group 7 of RAMP superfamily) [Caldicoprobacter guelmensis]|uniref:RAMP superfamily CRISPR-associated protein n=1 Tax=Caldicoprobacter guelmensis TaxID=1170224 RepID=UPI001958D485|nr:CRISPR/Cas system CSM-associated protein Csm3 (group 7 of RAMP superfamily) [Caldicoprobacter guelmensis]
MFLKKYNVSIEVQTPFNIASGEADGYIHKRTVRFRGKPYIPGSTIKGKVRSNFYKLTLPNHVDGICDCSACNIFGGQGYKPSRVYVDDFVLNDMPNDKGKSQEKKEFVFIRVGNAIDRYKRTAKHEALFITEAVRPAVFTGTITVYFDEDTLKYKQDLELAIKMIDSVGNGRSRGYGRVKVYLEEVT